MDSVLNISAYLFTPVDDRESLRTTLLARATSADLRGTVIVAHEGINMFLAGHPEAVRGFVSALRADPRFAPLETKESWSATQPFNKMLVKVKNEIIRMDHPAIRPAEGRARAVTPDRLRQWLTRGHDDEGREVVMLDTRNAFEVRIGTFTGAVDWRLERFTQFPAAARRHARDLAGKTVVTFCTGGIRCEKAAILMQDLGVDNVLQLDGGILGYFEEVGGEHFEGDCFVFDEREVLTPQLRVGGSY